MRDVENRVGIDTSLRRPTDQVASETRVSATGCMHDAARGRTWQYIGTRY